MAGGCAAIGEGSQKPAESTHDVCRVCVLSSWQSRGIGRRWQGGGTDEVNTLRFSIARQDSKTE